MGNVSATQQEWDSLLLKRQQEGFWGKDHSIAASEFPAFEPPKLESSENRRLPRFDDVEKPSHYGQALADGGVECIDYIRQQLGHEGFIAYCEGNMIKYGHRWRYKNGVQDLKKKRWYLERMIQEIEKETKK